MKMLRPLRKDYRPGKDVTFKGIKLALIEAMFDNDIETFQGALKMFFNKVYKFNYKSKNGKALERATGLRAIDFEDYPNKIGITMQNMFNILMYLNKRVKYEKR